MQKKRSRKTGRAKRYAIAAASVLCALASGCRPGSDIEIPRPPSASKETNTDLFEGTPIGNGFEGKRPWVAHVRAVDLDQDGLLDIIGCEAKEDEVIWLRQTESGGFEESVIGSDMQAPVHAEAYDLDQDGDRDVLVSSMNIVFPNNDRIGSLIVLENNGQNAFTQRTLLENVDRVTDARAADLDGDGDLDLAVGQFGYDQGEVRFIRPLGQWEFESEILLRLSGTINVTIDDYDGDGDPDIAALVSQQWEEVHLFLNDGSGNFESHAIWGSTNEDYASSGMSSGDLNGDGKPDLVFTNGDGFGPNPIPGPRPWHGVQWLENLGNGNFAYRRIGDLGGAYSPIIVDLNKDSRMDVLAISSFNDWSNPNTESLVWYRNDGSSEFTAVTLARDPIQLLTIDVADFDGSGRYSIASGGFHAYWPYERMSRFMFWRQKADPK